MQKECSSKDVIHESILDLSLVLNGHLYKYTAETPFYDRRFNDICDGTVSTDFCVQVKVTVNRLYHGFRRHFDE